MNSINIIIIIIFIIYVYRGYTDGGVRIITGFLGLIIAYIISVRYYSFGGGLLDKIFHISLGLNRFIAIVVTFIIVIILFEILSGFFYKKIPKEFRSSAINKYIGVALSFTEALILISFLIFIIININFFPDQSNIKLGIEQSTIGRYIIKENKKILDPLIGNEISKITLTKNVVIKSK
jgi:uncharacterized membrane protein required for colicin V production